MLTQLWPEEREWLVRKAALAGGLPVVLEALVRQAAAFERVYHDLQLADEVRADLARRGVLQRDARRRRPSAASPARDGNGR